MKATARYDYTWRGEPRALGAFITNDGTVEVLQLAFPGAMPGESKGTYVWQDGAIVGDGPLTSSQRTELQTRLQAQLALLDVMP